jgi:hypothetical protein
MSINNNGQNFHQQFSVESIESNSKFVKRSVSRSKEGRKTW